MNTAVGTGSSNMKYTFIQVTVLTTDISNSQSHFQE